MRLTFAPRHLGVSLVVGMLLICGCRESTSFHRAKRATQDSPTGPAGENPEPSSDDPAPPRYAVKARELYPLELHFQDALSLASGELPRGATYDAVNKVLRWLPQRGQAGMVSLPLSDSATLDIDVQARTNAEMLAGPPAVYEDGDVGYVFVHGASYEDYCLTSAYPGNYWGGRDALAPATTRRTFACYDGRNHVTESAARVAAQIIAADCGAFAKCIVVTHSMGGLIMEFMLTHSEPAPSGAAEPELYANAELFKKVKDKTLFVVAIASAAGGSRAANMLVYPDRYPVDKTIISQFLGLTLRVENATRDLTTERSAALAPSSADPAIPFFMVPSFSDALLGNLAEAAFLNDPTIFNNSQPLASVDAIVEYPSRSDGLVAFRSACGVASANELDGPGYRASLDAQFRYCASAPKKPNHFVWFAINLNHDEVKNSYAGCKSASTPCRAYFPNAATNTLVPADPFLKWDAMSIIRHSLIKDREGHAKTQTVSTQSLLVQTHFTP